ncbi:DHA1 family inner membrane transport protein [Arthrobacter stackebrandtii]|uniref:DHA1 family inner membrane transport protein n=1 Tax=Arthrobacter stackebrandtii TaxID=272161 RepID=A0ABS4YRY5_9MICC|nr:MFS transporter [Arthrobacter stackebrandtii]MBP2411245.1 DHA1 family inner membrane transport protein [Arthrobacter stackebrandtii]PYH00081.1 MFS transporter [Arthrobacter stackebrandtii]
MTLLKSRRDSVPTPPGVVGWAILALAIGGFGIGTTEFAMMGLLPNVAEGVGVSVPTAGHVISAYALGVVVGAPLLVAVSAKMRRKTLALMLMALFTVGNLLSVFAQDYVTLLITRFIAGLPHGAFFGVAAVLAASLVAPSKRGRAISMVMMGLSVANVVGVPLATYVGQQFGWRWLFILVAGIGVVTMAAIYAFIPNQKAQPDASLRKELGALRRGQVWLTLLVGVVGFGGFFAVYTYVANTMTDVAGFAADFLPVIVGLYGLGMVAGSYVGGRMADWSVMGSIYLMMGFITVILVIYAATVHVQWMALLMIFVIGASGSMLVPSLQTRLLDVSPGAPTLASSLNHSALNMANALGAFVGGLVITWGWGFTAPALVGAALAVLGLGIALFSGFLDKVGARRKATA